jgi:hypothetical protein
MLDPAQTVEKYAGKVERHKLVTLNRIASRLEHTKKMPPRVSLAMAFFVLPHRRSPRV